MASRWARRLVRATRGYLDAGENDAWLAVLVRERKRAGARARDKDIEEEGELDRGISNSSKPEALALAHFAQPLNR